MDECIWRRKRSGREKDTPASLMERGKANRNFKTNEAEVESGKKGNKQKAAKFTKRNAKKSPRKWLGIRTYSVSVEGVAERKATDLRSMRRDGHRTRFSAKKNSKFAQKKDTKERSVGFGKKQGGI